MKRVNIKRGELITHTADWETDQEMNTWIENQVAENSWGLPDRWVSSMGEPEEGYSESRETEMGMEYFYPAQYSIEILDVTDEAQARKESNEALQFLMETDFKVLRHQGQLALGISTSLSNEEYIALEEQRQEARTKVID